MSWWDSAGFTNLATQALKTAQQRIDKVLDISDNPSGGTKNVASSVTGNAKTSQNTGDEFWNNWLSADTETTLLQTGSSPFLSEKTKTETKVTTEQKVSKVASENESVRKVSTSNESTIQLQSSSERISSECNEIVSITKPKISQSDNFESVSLTATVSESLDTFSDKQSSVSHVASVSESLSNKTEEKKRSPLKLGGRSKSKEKVENAGEKGPVKPQSGEDALEEILKREKEAELKMMQLLGGRNEKVTKVLKATDTCDTPPTDLIKQKDKGVNEGKSIASTDEEKQTDTKSCDPFRTDVTESVEPKVHTELVSENVEQEPILEGDDNTAEQEVTEKVEILDEKLNILMDSDVMESSACNWDDAGLLTDSQIVVPDETIKSEEVDALETSGLKEIKDSGSLDHTGKVDGVIPPVEKDVAQDMSDDPADEPGQNLVEHPASPVSETIEDIPEHPSNMSADNQLAAEESVEAVDVVSVVSTLDESLTSETVDDLSSSNQTLTGEDVQSVTTSRTSETDMDTSENKDIEDSGRKSDCLLQTNEEVTKESGDLQGSEEYVEADLPSVHQGPLDKEISENEQNQHVLTSDVTTGVIHQPSPDNPVSSTTSQSMSTSQCSSSSFVKNMLEEAMVESVKDVDSRSDSHSSSDMVRIGSSQNSGHTSADELETATSSDIEIISHISTPTPNGENRGFSVDRPFDLSPLRHALNKAVRRNSPPGHHRTDSGSSGYSLQSRNGEDMTSPVDQGKGTDTDQQQHRVQDRRSDETPNNDPLEKEKLLKKLAEMAEILEARERKLVDLSRSNMDLMESNTILKNQLQQSEDAREAEMTDLNQLTEEFTKRISDTEKRLSLAAKERDAFKKSLQETEMALAQRSDTASTVEKMLREKDMQISELMEEGEKLSKQQLQSNNLMKKLRSKEKESEKLIKSQDKKIETQNQELDRLQKVLDNKCDVEKKHTESINQLQSLVKNQEKELEKHKSDSEEAQEKLRSVQAALDNSYKEIAELHKATVRRASEVQERALSAELQSKQVLQKELERYKVQVRQEQEALVNQIEDLQLSMSRMEKEHGRREDVLRQEISDLHQRLQEGEDRNQDLTDSVTAATRPLLRQIENLQSTYTAQSTSYEKVEKNLTDRLTEAHHQLAMAQEKERVATEQLLDINARVASYESQLSTLRQDRSRLQAQLEMERTKVEVLEDAKNKESAQREALQHSLESRLSELKKEKLLLENQLEMEKLKVEAEKKKLLLAHEQLRDKELQLSQVKSRPTTPADTLPLKDSVDNTMLGSLASMTASSMSASFLSQGDEMERSFVLSPKASSASLYESMRNSGAASLMENLQSQLKQKDGEIVQLQNEIHELEHTRESMARELVNQANQNQELEDKAKELPEALRKYKELDQRYNALLQMYGEKEEEVQELRLDLQDMKELYKSQIQELLQKS